MALQNHHRRRQLRLKSQRGPSTEVVLSNLLALAALVSSGCCPAVRLSIVFHHYQSVRVTFSVARVYPRRTGDLAMEPTDLPVLETLHIAHVLEQDARGYLTGANSNKWRQHVFSNQGQSTEANVLTCFYRFEFQSQGTLHLHMLVWVKDLSLIWANLLHASIPWNNANEPFVVADTQESSSSCLPLYNTPDTCTTS